MRDHDRGAAGQERTERGHQASLRHGVEVGRRLVEDQDRGVPDDRPRDREAPPLPAAESDAVLTDPRVVALREGRDEVVKLGQAARGLDLLVGHVRVGQGQVVADRRIEQVHPLRHDPEQAPGVVGPQLAEVAAADEDLARPSSPRTGAAG